MGGGSVATYSSSTCRGETPSIAAFRPNIINSRLLVPSRTTTQKKTTTRATTIYCIMLPKTIMWRVDRRPHLWTWGLLLSTLVVGIAVEAVCDLDCPTAIGATCAYGDSPHIVLGTTNTTTSTNINGMHCSCPLLYTGLRCEVPYESCGDGQHECYHGGICRQGEVDDFGNVQLFCDCSTATGGDDPTAVFVGKYCQHSTVSAESTKCDSSNQDTFCFNQGVCNTQYP